MKEKKTKRIHIALIILIIILGAGLVFELYNEGLRSFSKELGVKPQRQGYIIVPPDEWEVREWDPYNEMTKIQRRMDQWFNRMWKNMPGGEIKRIEMFEPDIDFTENENEYIIICDLPGMNKDEIDISVQGNSLIISGTRNIQKEETKGKGYYYEERRSGYFKRNILLPGPVLENNVKADYSKGILTIRIPKRKIEEEIKPKKVQII